MDRKKNLLYRQEAAETFFASRGKYRGETASGAAALSALRLRTEKGDYRKAEAMARGADDELELLKSLLARGLLDEGREVLDALLAHPELDPGFLSELLLQRARYFSLTGEWTACAVACTEAENRPELPALTRMTLLQIRSNALFEAGDFRKSAADLGKFESLETLFPKNRSLSVYARANRVRLEFRTAGPEAGSALEARTWNSELRAPQATLDPLLTLLRMRIDRARLLRLEHRAAALAAWRIARALGDDLFEALAFLDYVVATPARERAAYAARLARYRADHPRVDGLAAEAFGDRAVASSTETGRTMRAYLEAAESGSPGPNADPFASALEITRIALPHRRVLADLERRTVSPLRTQRRSDEILLALATGPRTKEALFRSLWNLSFVKDRHDAAIRTALHRIREQCGISVQSSDLVLTLPASTLVLDLSEASPCATLTRE